MADKPLSKIHLKEPMRTFLSVFFIALFFRMFMYLVSAVIIMFFKSSLDTMSFDLFLDHWLKWDAHHYINIAENGYRNALEACPVCHEALIRRGISPDRLVNGEHLFLVFFPLYPYLIRLLLNVFSNARLIGICISTISYCLGCYYMYLLCRKDYDKKTATLSVILLSIFPYSFFFGGIMTEGLFFFVSAAALYYIREHRWWIAVLFGILVTATRMQGALIIIPAVVELCLEYRPLDAIKEKNSSQIRGFLLRGLSFALMLLGIGSYLLANYLVDGSPFAFMIYQENHWYQKLSTPFQTAVFLWKNAFAGSVSNDTFTLWYPQLFLIFFSLIVLLSGIRKIRLSYLLYAFSYYWLTFSASFLLSSGRYMSCCIPFFLILALHCEKHVWLKRMTVLSFLVFYMLTYVAFFQNMRVM